MPARHKSTKTIQRTIVPFVGVPHKSWNFVYQKQKYGRSASHVQYENYDLPCRVKSLAVSKRCTHLCKSDKADQLVEIHDFTFHAHSFRNIGRGKIGTI
jgi:hypothetical protein